jgi:prepilin-type N-terminal cleavage/methylation domain-containing protein
MKLKRQKGFTLGEMLLVLGIMGTIAVATLPKEQFLYQQGFVDAAARDLQSLQHAYNRFYAANRRNPASMAELQPYYNGRMTSPWNTPYQGTATANGFTFSVNTNSAAYASKLQNTMGNAQLSGTAVSKGVPIPLIETIASQQLHRVAIAGRPELNQQQTDIDATGNDVVGVDTFDANEANVNDVYAQTVDTDILDAADEVVFGANSITHSGNTLSFNAGTVAFNGNVSLQGDMDANGNDITNIGNFDADNATFQDFTTTDLFADNATIDTANITNGSINTLTGQSLNYANGTIDTFSFTTANGQRIDVNRFDTNVFNAGTFTSTTGIIDDLSGTSLDYNTGNITQLSGGTFTYNQGNINYVNAAEVNTNRTYANYANFSNGVYDRLTVSGTLDGGQGDFGRVDTNDVTTNVLSAVSVDTGSFVVNGTLTSDDVYSDNFNISGTTNTNRLISNQSSLGTADASSLSVSGRSSAGNFVGGDASFDQVSASQYYGGNFFGSDFTTSTSSVNNNYDLATDLQQQWDTCEAQGGCQ